MRRKTREIKGEDGRQLRLMFGLPKPKEPKPVPVLILPEKTCANCEIGWHEHCRGYCDCCIPF